MFVRIIITIFNGSYDLYDYGMTITFLYIINFYFYNL